VKSGKAEHHRDAAAAHREAADTHANAGNKEHAEAHYEAAAKHDAAARRAGKTRNQRGGGDVIPEHIINACTCQTTRAALQAMNAKAKPDDMDDDDDDDDDNDDDMDDERNADEPHSFDEGKPQGGGSVQAGGKGTKDEYQQNRKRQQGLDSWERSMPPAARGIWNTAKRMERQGKILLVNRLIAHVQDGKRRNLIGNRLLQLDMADLEERVSLLPPTYNEGHGGDPAPVYFPGGFGDGPTSNSRGLTENERKDVLPLVTVNDFDEEVRAQENKGRGRRAANA
jgi:hypothetical protein